MYRVTSIFDIMSLKYEPSDINFRRRWWLRFMNQGHFTCKAGELRYSGPQIEPERYCTWQHLFAANPVKEKDVLGKKILSREPT